MNSLPIDVIAHIQGFACIAQPTGEDEPPRARLSDLSRVCGSWKEALEYSESVPYVVAASRPDVFRRLPRSGTMSWEVVRNRFNQAKALEPLEPGTLHPIENCPNAASCPCFGEALTMNDDIKNPCQPMTLRCATCANKCIPVLRKAPENEAGSGPYVPSQIQQADGKPAPSILRRADSFTYDSIVFDTDGVSAHRFLRAVKALQGESYNVDQTALTSSPSFRYMGGSCAHQYDIVPMTINSTGSGEVLSERFDGTMSYLGVSFVIMAHDFDESLVPWDGFRSNGNMNRKELLKQNNNETLSDFASRVVDYFESWCGSETFSGGDDDDEIARIDGCVCD